MEKQKHTVAWVVTVLVFLLMIATACGAVYLVRSAPSSSPVPDFYDGTTAVSSDDSATAQSSTEDPAKTTIAEVDLATTAAADAESESTTASNASDGMVEEVVEELAGAAEEQ